MLLRASGESSGEKIDLRAVTEGEAATSGLPGGEALTAFVDAAILAGAEAIRAARDRVVAELGEAAMVDAAGVIGNFERMVRIADGTGIPLDKPVALVSADMREELGIDSFAGAEHTAALAGIQRLTGRLLSRMLPLVMRTFRPR
jgi:hypothetical protein